MYGTELDWAEIKRNLIAFYSDKRNETSLIRDLYEPRQKSAVENLYSKMIVILA